MGWWVLYGTGGSLQSKMVAEGKASSELGLWAIIVGEAEGGYTCSRVVVT